MNILNFANSNGGKLHIWVDDDGKVISIDNAKKLLEDIPNKVRDILGVMADVNLHVKEGKEYLEITTEKYPYPMTRYIESLGRGIEKIIEESQNLMGLHHNLDG